MVCVVTGLFAVHVNLQVKIKGLVLTHLLSGVPGCYSLHKQLFYRLMFYPVVGKIALYQISGEDQKGRAA